MVDANPAVPTVPSANARLPLLDIAMPFAILRRGVPVPAIVSHRLVKHQNYSMLNPQL